MKKIVFLGDSRESIRNFPDEPKYQTGQELLRIQFGRDPLDWKPMKTVGTGVREIRVSDATGAFRTLYVASRPEAIYVLHAFQKKSQATPLKDIALARKRLRGI
ncbi:MAG: type II toxin-antitoxin system RelE/ParE family toxin [Rhizobiaceae bacterium]